MTRYLLVSASFLVLIYYNVASVQLIVYLVQVDGVPRKSLTGPNALEASSGTLLQIALGLSARHLLASIPIGHRIFAMEDPLPNTMNFWTSPCPVRPVYGAVYY